MRSDLRYHCWVGLVVRAVIPIYAPHKITNEHSLASCRLPDPDQSTPSRAEMKRILDVLDGALQHRHDVYVHCWGGIGRTGTVVGGHMVRCGMTGKDAALRDCPSAAGNA